MAKIETGARVPTTSAEESIWLEAQPPARRPALDRDVQVDVAVIGGGIAGITTAILLKRTGARVAVLEAAQVAGGVTGTNTAKVSALQSTIYSTIRSHHGDEGAAAYAQASVAGVEQIATLAAEEGIDCDLHRRPAFTYATDEEELRSVEREAEAAAAAGLPALLTDYADLPFPVAGAVMLEHQLELHPVRYVLGLAEEISNDDSLVFENSRVLAVEEGSPCRVTTSGATVLADRVVIATHYPLLDRGLFFARLELKRSYCIAARVIGDRPQGMSISAGSTTRSIRSYGELLIVGGEGHNTGSGKATHARYEALEEFARANWDVKAVSHRWSAQDAVSYDHLPVIGPYTPRSSRVYVASGFMKWGLSGGTMAGMLLSDLLSGRENPWSKHFEPSRLSLRSAPKLVQMNAKVGIEFFGERLRPASASSAEEIPLGEARVVRDGLGKTGIYRDTKGSLHAVSLRCTHLGCLVRFNEAERSWDCPCHGSRFDVDGAVLEGPATKPLAQREVDLADDPGLAEA